MDILSKEELGNINGGGKAVWFFLGGLVLFALGVFCGFFEK